MNCFECGHPIVVPDDAACFECTAKLLEQSLERHKERDEEIKQLESERDRLKEALEPFAKLYDEPKHGERDGCPMFIGYEREDCDADFTVGDLRRAAAALADAGKGGGE